MENLKKYAPVMAVDAVIVALAIVVRIIIIIFGLLAILVALPFAKPTGEINDRGWQMWHMPRWAWPWDNDRNGVYGDKSGRYVREHGTGFWWRYNWTAIRNPANNASRHWLGFNVSEVTNIEYAGTENEADEGVAGWSYYRAKTEKFVYPGFVWSGPIRGKNYSFYAGWKIRKNKAPNDGQIGLTISLEKW